MEEIVLQNLRRMTAFARDEPDDFYRTAVKRGRTEAKKLREQIDRRRKNISERISKLNNILRCLYEDRVIGRITPERYDEMSAGYESELAERNRNLRNSANSSSRKTSRKESLRSLWKRHGST